jgi:hypothetical protein
MPLSPRTHGANELIQQTGRKLDSSNNTKKNWAYRTTERMSLSGAKCQDGKMAVIEFNLLSSNFFRVDGGFGSGDQSVSKLFGVRGAVKQLSRRRVR